MAGRRSPDTEVKIVGIEGHTAGERPGTRQRMGVAPGDLVQAACAVDQIPVARRSLPLTERAIVSALQQSSPYVGQRQVEGGWLGRFADCPGGAVARYFESPPKLNDLTCFSHEPWRPREISNRDLPWCRDIGERRPLLASPKPLLARALKPGGLAAHDGLEDHDDAKCRLNAENPGRGTAQMRRGIAFLDDDAVLFQSSGDAMKLGRPNCTPCNLGMRTMRFPWETGR